MNDFIQAINIAFCYVFLSPSFIIKIRKGKVIVVKGRPKGAFIYNCNEIIHHNNITSAVIYTQKGNYGEMLLHCSGSLGKDAVQQFRNAWVNNK